MKNSKINLSKNYKAIVNEVNYDNSLNILVDKSDIETSVLLFELIVYDISSELEFFTNEIITDLQKDFNNELFDWIDLESHLKDKYKREFKIYMLKEIENYGDLEVLSLTENEITKENLIYYNTELTHTYWNGSNHKTIYLESNYYVINWNLCNWINLDEWNGNDWNFGQVGIHCKVSKNPHNIDEYLVCHSSQYENDLTTCDIMTLQELETFLTENNRQKYLEEIINS